MRRVYFDHNATTAVPPEVAQSAIRFSLGGSNTEEEIDYVVEVWPKIVQRLRDISPLYRKAKIIHHRAHRGHRAKNLGLKSKY